MLLKLPVANNSEEAGITGLLMLRENGAELKREAKEVREEWKRSEDAMVDVLVAFCILFVTGVICLL